ncbi:MAG: hypothetical protein ACR2OG_12885 [Gemmatimonadaceae bacterium]
MTRSLPVSGPLVILPILVGCATSGAQRRAPEAASPAVVERAPTRPAGDTLYDLIIRHGRVLDGEGNPWILADVGIRDGHFAKIGKITGRAPTEIDATGKYVSPGWIDMMDQSGSVLPRSGRAENKLQEGATTAIGGEGGTPVPAARVGEYFASLERQGISINFGSYFSETQARAAVLGMSARQPTPAELDRIRAIMDTAMRGGAMGMTTALIYPPSSYSTTDELVEVAKSAARYGGTYASHIRGEGKEVVESVKEAIAIGERAGLPVEVFHLKVAHRAGWGILMDSVGRAVDAARARRRCRGGSLRVHGRRHRPRGHHPELGARGRDRLAPGPARHASATRPDEGRARDRSAWLVEHRRGRGRMGRCRTRERAQPGQREVRAEDHRPDRERDRKGPGRRGVGSGRRRPGSRDGDLSHDGRAGHRDRAALSVDQHRQRRRRRAPARYTG